MKEEEGEKVPALDEDPEVEDFWDPVWRGFLFLHSTRQCAFGPNPIQLSEVLAYLALFPSPDPQEFAHCVRALDSAYLSWWQERNETKEKK